MISEGARHLPLARDNELQTEANSRPASPVHPEYGIPHQPSPRGTTSDRKHLPLPLGQVRETSTRTRRVH